MNVLFFAQMLVYRTSMRYFVLIIGLALTLPLFWLRGGLFQEPLPTAYEAARLELSGQNWRSVEGGARVLIKANHFKEFLKNMEKGGWVYSEQLGSGYVFARGDKFKILGCRLYSRRYKVCTVPVLLSSR